MRHNFKTYDRLFCLLLNASVHVMRLKAKRRKPKSYMPLDFRLKIIYRISDVGNTKIKPSYVNNETCLRNASDIFLPEKHEWLVIADNCGHKTAGMIEKYIPKRNISHVSVGHGAGTFNLAFDEALKGNDRDAVYFLENDYLHKIGAEQALKEGLALPFADYVTLYDHLDKYLDSENPFVKDGGEVAKVFSTASCHWKTTNSTTMTFAAKISVLRKDERVFRRWTYGRHPFDFQLFCNLRMLGRKLISPLPGYSTHGETAYMAPLTDWASVPM